LTDRSVDSVPLGESIGENLARLRKVRDLSQERLAEAADVDVGVDTVARLEQAKRSNVRPVTLRKLADALGVSVDDLIGRPRPGDLKRSISPDCVAPSRRTANFAILTSSPSRKRQPPLTS
jgi:transcriptional regulator with XRE-family HTH domain